MASRPRERCHEAQKWLVANYGKGILSPLTGTDWRAFAALVHLWDLWAYTRLRSAQEAAVLVLCEMQVSTRDIGVALIPFAADWSDEVRVRGELALRIIGVSAVPWARRKEVV